MRRLSWLITLPVAIVLVLFAVINRKPVAVDLWPLPFAAELPAFLLPLGGAAFGVLIGAVAVGAGMLRWRRRTHRAERRIALLERELAALHQERRRAAAPDAERPSPRPADQRVARRA